MNMVTKYDSQICLQGESVLVLGVLISGIFGNRKQSKEKQHERIHERECEREGGRVASR